MPNSCSLEERTVWFWRVILGTRAGKLKLALSEAGIPPVHQASPALLRAYPSCALTRQSVNACASKWTFGSEMMSTWCPAIS